MRAVRHRHMALGPRDPALLAAHVGHALVEQACAVAAHLDQTGGLHDGGLRAADQCVGACAQQGCIGAVGIADPAIGRAPHDQVALRLNQAAVPLLALGHGKELVVQPLRGLGKVGGARFQPPVVTRQQPGSQRRDGGSHCQHHTQNDKENSAGHGCGTTGYAIKSVSYHALVEASLSRRAKSRQRPESMRRGCTSVNRIGETGHDDPTRRHPGLEPGSRAAACLLPESRARPVAISAQGRDDGVDGGQVGADGVGGMRAARRLSP